ncbi:sensory rhodopsin transducer [Gracilibacillus sp. YIM 98692]|uniref:sensory rhodopsin transducer n=1 Tax=Gracilibacillus sp. YIM 98692 TaxID=2663532 RepID=UPI0013D72555|nr:sensory rhodopsin transducer [Gracilibacillus sp. YIM 98692]
MTGKKKWIIPDGFLQPKSTGDEVSHEAVCVLNLGDEAATIHLTFYFEDRDPMDAFVTECGAKRTHHIRLDKLTDQYGNQVPRGVPYAIEVNSSVPIIVQHSRLDTSQEALALFTTMAYSTEDK